MTGRLENIITLPLKLKSAAGIALAPPSNGGGGAHNVYVVDRGVDNDTNQDTFNDGRMYELSIPGLGGGGGGSNAAPSVSAGPDRSVTLPAGAALDGTVTDSTPTGTLTTGWSEVSGPGSVSFGDASAVDTTASFSAAGSYVLRLTADDGSLSASDTMTVTVAEGTSPPPAGGGSLDVPVRSAGDDAEENQSGGVTRGSSDLNLTRSGTATMTVGLRFADVAVPAGATITGAWVQFQADESQSVATNLTIRAQDVGHAPGFSTATGNITGRLLTSADAGWAPPAWSAGQRGAAQRTPDLAGVLQEVVSRGDWASGNALVLVIDGTGERTAEAYNSGASLAPVLHIEYTT